MSTPAPTALVAEDEAPQRRALCEALAEAWPALQLIAVCADGSAALDALERQTPAVAFLDIRMPGESGLVVAREAAARGTLVVFTTAYDAHAIEAFDAGAVDYLLKPVQPARLVQAVQRVQARLDSGQTPDLQDLIDQLEARLRPSAACIRWITASAGDTVRMIGIDEVLFFQAQDKLVRVVTAQGEAVIRMPLKELLDGLDPTVFWQVHRGAIVRVSCIDRVHKDELGRHVLSLRGHAQTLPVSAGFMHRFRGM